MNVLQAALGVVGHFEAQQFLHLGVPCGRQIGDGQASAYQGRLEIEARDHMEPVGNLVGFRPYQAWLNLVDGLRESVDPDAIEGTFSHQRDRPKMLPPEFRRATDDVFHIWIATRALHRYGIATSSAEVGVGIDAHL